MFTFKSTKNTHMETENNFKDEMRVDSRTKRYKNGMTLRMRDRK